MKYFAILKDSFREALDTKVFYVMLVLSLLVFLFLLTLTFEPLPADRYYGPLVQGGYLAGIGDMDGADDHMRKQRPQVEDEGVAVVDGKKIIPLPKSFNFTVVQTKPIGGSDDSPGSTYLVTVRTSVGSSENVALVQSAPKTMLDQLRKRLTKVGDLGLARIRDIRLADRTNPAVANDQGGSNFVYCEFVAEPAENTRRLWPHKLEIMGTLPLGGGEPLGLLLYIFASIIMTVGGWVTLVISIVLTAFFIPNMLRKGTVDLLLVKPTHRPTLLLYKYFGGLTFIFLNTAVAIGGAWLALGLKSGVWANNFLLMIAVLTFFFAILYAVSTLFGVLTRSPIVAILATCFAWFVFFVVGTTYNFIDQETHRNEARNVPAEDHWTNNTFCKVVRVIHFVTPRTSDLNRLGSINLAKDFLTETLVKDLRIDRTSITWGESISVSLVFIFVMLGVSSWWFSTKDY
jgi:ABC-type transport system involved in multi-copper enzyme maturation permease subunit